jgi:hypothetical protein
MSALYWREVVNAAGDLTITHVPSGLTRHYTAKQLATKRAPQFALRAIKDSIEAEAASTAGKVGG